MDESRGESGRRSEDSRDESGQKTQDSRSESGQKAGPKAEPSIGRYLAAQRRLRGFSLEELAELTKIPRRSLERLESGAFDRSSDGFARGFVRTVAGALGLDPDETVNRLLSEPLAADDEDDRAPLALARWAVAAAALLLVVVAVLGVRLVASLSTAEPSEVETPPVVYRHDPVRALAETGDQEPSETAPELPSARGEHPD